MKERWRTIVHPLGDPRGYLLAFGLSNAIGALRLLLNPGLHAENPFLLSAFAVLIAAGLGGLGPGLLATGIGALWGIYILPAGSPLDFSLSGGAIRLGLFIPVSVAIVLLVDSWRRAKERAVQALRLRDDFLRIAAHELNTPLTVMLANAELLQDRLGTSGSLTPQHARMLSSIIRQARHQRDLIRLLLDISHLEQGQLPLQMAALDFGAIVRQVVEESQPGAPAHQIVLHTVAGPVPIRGDAARLEQVLQNLVQNAIKYSPRGGAIDVCLAIEDREAVLRIRDQGIGIPVAEQARIFDRFYRAGNAASGPSKGFGIGLYIVREIITRHGGSIAVQSAEGQGSSFTLRLPLSD